MCRTLRINSYTYHKVIVGTKLDVMWDIWLTVTTHTCGHCCYFSSMSNLKPQVLSNSKAYNLKNV